VTVYNRVAIRHCLARRCCCCCC